MEKVKKNSKPGYKQTKIGLIPNDWELCAFEDIADKKVKWSITGGPFGSNLKAEDYTPTGIRIIQLQNIGDGKFLNDYKIFTSKEKADELLSCNIYPGEIIISKMGDPVARACVIPNGDSRYLMASDGIRLVIDKKNFDKTFVLSFINWNIFRSAAIKNGTGTTRQRIGLDELKNLPFVKPPLPEQQKIARILSTWDKAIEKTEQLIAQRQQLKKGLMQQLLTGKVRFKEFVKSNKMKKTKLGLVPMDWEVRKLGDIAIKIGSGITPTGGEAVYKGSGRPFIRSQNVGWGMLLLDDVAFIDENTHQSFVSTEVKNKDVLLNITGASIGRCAVADERIQDGNVNQHVCIIRTADTIDQYFLNYFILSKKGQNLIDSFQAGGNRQGLNFEQIRSFTIPIPGPKEQKRIASILKGLDNRIERQSRIVEELRNQKKGLIQKLLTGDVRVKA